MKETIQSSSVSILALSVSLVLSATVRGGDSATFGEAFYNIEISPAMHVTLDAQVSDSALPSADTAVILGTSMQIRF